MSRRRPDPRGAHARGTAPSPPTRHCSSFGRRCSRPVCVGVSPRGPQRSHCSPVAVRAYSPWPPLRTHRRFEPCPVTSPSSRLRSRRRPRHSGPRPRSSPRACSGRRRSGSRDVRGRTRVRRHRAGGSEQPRPVPTPAPDPAPATTAPPPPAAPPTTASPAPVLPTPAVSQTIAERLWRRCGVHRERHGPDLEHHHQTGLPVGGVGRRADLDRGRTAQYRRQLRYPCRAQVGWAGHRVQNSPADR